MLVTKVQWSEWPIFLNLAVGYNQGASGSYNYQTLWAQKTVFWPHRPRVEKVSLLGVFVKKRSCFCSLILISIKDLIKILLMTSYSYL